MKKTFVVWAVLAALCGASVSAAAATVEYTGATNRDPFKSQLPAVKQSAKPDEKASVKDEPVTVDFLTVTGVVWDSEKPQAIINGKVVSIGGQVSGAELVAINEAGVQVRDKGKLFVLKAGNKKGGQP